MAGQHQDKPPTDWRACTPYWQEEALKENADTVREIESMAKDNGVTVAQLSLAWVVNQGNDVFPIPGTTKLEHLEENVKAAKVTLTKEEITKIASMAGNIKGTRGNDEYMTMAYQAFQ